MNYQILMPVTVRPDLVRDKIMKVPELSRLTIVNNFIDPDIETLCKEAEDSGAEILRFPRNLGCGASCNIGLRRVLDGTYDVVIIMAPSTDILCDFRALLDLIEEMEDSSAGFGRYQFSPTAKNHLFAMNRTGCEIGGLYDEHFYPAYLEDTDWNWRSRHNGMVGKVHHFNRPDLVGTYGYSISLSDPLIRRLHQTHSHMRSVYYQNKWGSHPPGQFIHPFNREDLDINYWEPVSHSHEIW